MNDKTVIGSFSLFADVAPEVTLKDLKEAHPNCIDCKNLCGSHGMFEFFCPATDWGMTAMDVQNNYCSEWEAKQPE